MTGPATDRFTARAAPAGMETASMSYGESDRVSAIERVIEKWLTQREAASMLGLTSR